MRLIRRLFLLSCLVATFGLVWAAVYARKEGFTKSWRDAIEREFAQRGYYVDIGKLTLGAFRGLVAEDVRFFQEETRTQEIAVIDDVYLDVDLSRVFSEKQISVNTLDVQEASLSLPLDPTKPDGRRLRVTGLSGRVVITESVIEVVKAEASIVGMDLSIKGTLVRPPLEEEEKKEEEDEKSSSTRLAEQRRQIMRFLKDFETYEFSEGRPKVEIEFRGDLDDLATTTARARIAIPSFSKQGQTYRVESLATDVSYDGGTGRAVIESLQIRDAKGVLNLTGEWTQEEERLNFAVESTADVASLGALFSNDRKLGEVVFFNPPAIKASGHLLLGSRKKAPTSKGLSR